MTNLTVALLGPDGYGNNIGKKGTTTDITVYNLKKDDDTITLIEPSGYPERLAPLFYATSLAERAIVVVEELDANLGERLVMLSCSDVEGGYFILRNYLPKEKIQRLIKGTRLENFEFLEDTPTILKDRLLNETSELKGKRSESKHTTGIVPVDHFFNVKGVGTVVLGLVASGEISKHDEVKVLPGNKTAQIRSIQKHDDEFSFAIKGDRVGLAVKNVDLEDLDRGTVLTNDPSIKATTRLKTNATLVKYWQAPMKSEMVVHLGHWMQFIPARIEEITEEKDWHTPQLTLSLGRELIHRPGDKAVISHLEGGKLRVAGTIELP